MSKADDALFIEQAIAVIRGMAALVEENKTLRYSVESERASYETARKKMDRFDAEHERLYIAASKLRAIEEALAEPSLMVLDEIKAIVKAERPDVVRFGNRYEIQVQPPTPEGDAS